MPISGALKYAAIHAHVRVMYSALLAPQVFARMRESADFSALIGLLKDTTYGSYLARVEDKDLTPRRAVYQIKGKVADAYLTIIRLAPAPTRPLLAQLYRHFEVDNLKAVLRGIVTGASWDRVRYVLFPMESFTVLPAQSMVEAGSIESAVEQLSDTPYYETLTHAMKRYTDEHSLFPLEVALDLGYWRELWHEVTRLPGQERLQSKRIVGALLDMNNLMWAIRYKMYHHLSEEEIVNYTLPFGYRVRDQDIRAIAAGAAIPQVVARIFPDMVGVANLLHETRERLSELELKFQRYVAKQCRVAFIGYPFHIGIPLAYVVLNELEIQDLIVFIEGKSLKMLTEEFQPYLLMESPSK
jgi:V/A-type H+-transporting ATPase subunit C